MTTVTDHYRHHLAPVYVWMAGGVDAALARGESEIAAICSSIDGSGVAIDLGAGFGMHTIPLAGRGCHVIAIDSSALLLGVLREHSGGLPIRIVEDDLLNFARHLTQDADLALCMGDTLTHLPDEASVERLFASVAQSLRPGGRFIVSFRDYTSPLVGAARFIPVRSDENRTLTCFLEYADDHVTVHDMLHEREASSWRLRVSSYRKLRLSPRWVTDALQARGFTAHVESGLAGMIRIVAARGRRVALAQ